MESERLFPDNGPFPVTAHLLDIPGPPFNHTLNYIITVILKKQEQLLVNRKKLV